MNCRDGAPHDWLMVGAPGPGEPQHAVCWRCGSVGCIPVTVVPLAVLEEKERVSA
jgi:hypothetical protein